MMTSETKQRINSARQVLVGKVPDPKAQVEQITNALIYKFMDDMDEQARALGGNAEFFTGAYEKYAWTKLMDPKIGAQDRLNLYVEALTKLSTRPKLPQLFREIFKGSFLPYRDPATLSLFLKEIDYFDYSHSEELGNAFEYLLSILGSQGEAGQFRTPRHIIDFIVDVVEPTKSDTILDPACGTAGFLISAYKHIVKQHDGVDESGKRVTEVPLTPKERAQLMSNISGYDISPEMVKLSLVNMYLHGFTEPHVMEHDTLTSEDFWDKRYDVIMANPPFMTPKGGIRPHNKFSVQANRAEVLFVDYISEHLAPRGRAAVIVPEGVLHNDNLATRTIRKRFIEEEMLWAAVELPHGAFKPYASVKTHILFLDKERAKKSPDVLFIEITNDGRTQTGTRKPMPGNEIPEALNILKAFKSGNMPGKTAVATTLVPKTDLLQDEIQSLVGRRYRALSTAEKSQWPSVTLDPTLITVKKGKSPIEKTAPGDYPFVVTAEAHKSSDHSDFQGPAICVPLVSSSGHGHASVQRIHYIEGEFALANIMCGIFVKNTKKLLPKFLYHLLLAEKDDILASLMTGTSNVSMTMKDIYKIKIPLPPPDVQARFVKIANKLEDENSRLKSQINKNLGTVIKEFEEIWGANQAGKR